MLTRLILRFFDRLDPQKRRFYAARLFVWSFATWIVAAIAVALVAWGPGQVFQQLVLLVSFEQIWIACIDVICTTDVRANADDQS